jgi:hypothetical protein
MRRDVQLFVNDQRVDLFDFEDINIVDSIQDVRDISKIFVPFSRQFTVPASKNNNKIFKHYYNPEIVDGFDARFKISAVIKINGQLYKRGRITLLGASLSDNKPRNYKIVFYDNTIDLKALIGEDELSDLGGDFLYSYSLQDYDIDKCKTGVQNGFVRNLVGGDYVMEEASVSFPDVAIPFISTRNYYFYDTGDNPNPTEGGSESRNLWASATTTPRGLNWKDLRPSIKVSNIINAIENNYEINFGGSFFTSGTDAYNRLYLWLNSDKGLYGEELSVTTPLSDFNLTSGNELQPLIAKRPTIYVNGIFYKVFLNITIDDQNEQYNLIVRNKIDNYELFNQSLTGSSTIPFKLINNSYTPKEYDLEFEISNLNSTVLTMDCTVEKWYDPYRGTSTILETSTYYIDLSTSSVFSISQNMPKIKVIDFLTGLFKMFNLTAYVGENGSLNVETLDNYYSNGNEIDVTRYVDTNNIDVSRNKLYSKIDFTFAEPKTFATINSNEITNDEFGNERMENVNEDGVLSSLLAFDGGEYDVSVKFEKMQYERMSDQETGDLTGIGWGWCVDKDQKETTTAPLLHYIEKTYTINDNTDILWDNLDDTYSSIDKYFRPSNSLSTQSVSGQSLHFGSEQDEFYTGLSSNKTSLFNIYWRNYILSIYDEKSRIVSFNANLPTSIINTVKLNDVLVINRKKYRINKLDVNITTGKTKLELITYKEITPYYRDEYRIDSDLITIDSDLITIDTI